MYPLGFQSYEDNFFEFHKPKIFSIFLFHFGEKYGKREKKKGEKGRKERKKSIRGIIKTKSRRQNFNFPQVLTMEGGGEYDFNIFKKN